MPSAVSFAAPARQATASWPAIGGRLVVGLVAASLAVVGWLLHHAGLTLALHDPGNHPYEAAGTAALLLRFAVPRERRWARQVGDAAGYFALFTLIALAGAVASYPVAALTTGFHDATLQRLDRAMQFDWIAWYRTVAAHPLLQTLGIAAYRSIYLTPALILGHHAIAGTRGEAYRFLLTFWGTAVATLALFALMPAVGPFAYLWHGAVPYMPESELWQPSVIPALRAHAAPAIVLSQLRGLVSAPSFHAAAATLYIAAAWPIARLRWPLLALNAAMLLATPVEGTHYLTDLLLGIAVALAVSLVTRRMAVE